jgi:hypothetical protein
LRRPEHGPDTKFKLYINVKKLVYNCFRCEVRGRLTNLFPQLAIIGEYAEQTVKASELKNDQLEPYPEFQYLGALQYPWNEIVEEFLTEKRFTINELWDKVHFIEDYRKGEFSFGPCLLFAVYHFGQYRGFQARRLYKNVSPKYIGASNMDRRSSLYNYDNAFSQSDCLVITEGFFDALRVGFNAVATLGKTITETQIRLIRLGKFEKVIVFLDKDAEKEAATTAKNLSLYFKTYLALPKWPENKKDPGDLSKDEINHVFKSCLERVY